MEIDDALMEIFLTEAHAYLEVLNDPRKGSKEKGDAAHGMKGVAAMLQFQELSEEAAVLEKQLREGDDSELSARVVAIEKHLARIEGEAAGQPGGGRSDQPPAEGSEGEVSDPEETDPEEKNLSAGDGEELGPTPEESAAEEEWDAETAAMLQSIFKEEAQEHLANMESCLERLREDIQDAGAVNELFRAAHTLKGAASTVGLAQIGQAAHKLENRFEDVRSGKRCLDERGLDVCLEATAVLDEMAACGGCPSTLQKLTSKMEQILESEADAARTEPGQATRRPKKKNTGEPAKKKGGRRKMSVAPSVPSVESAATARAAEKSSNRRRIGRTPTYAPSPERRSSDRRHGDRRDEDRRIIRIPVDRVDSLMDSVGELVFARTRIQRRTDEVAGLQKDLAGSHRALRTALTGVGLSSADQKLLQRLSEIEVEFADEAANFDRAITGLLEEAEWLRRLTSTLQEGLIGLRMMSVKFLMARLRRAAREVARAQDKRIEVILEGEETELDKSVAERLIEPMVHLIRNGVGHGIEPPKKRSANGKDPQGKIYVKASQQGENVLLEVADDGRGIELDAVRETVIRKGMMTRRELAGLSDDQVLQLIFRPGFTTRTEADDISGRGVGLDAVSESIGALSGELHVESKPGEGTRFVLRLPLLAAITNALLFKVGGEVYALSLSHVEETLLLSEKQVRQSKRNRGIVSIGDEVYPLLDLSQLLEVETKRHGRHVPAFLGRWGHQKLVAICDKMIGPREIVVKQLGGLLAPLPYYCGATISGAGKVQLVLDAAALARAAMSRTAAKSKRTGLERSEARRILVCDDSRSIREVVSRILLQAGYKVELASDGWDAWERMSAAAVDLLLTDLEMPRLDGYALIERVRRAETYQKLPIVVLTSRTGQANRKRAMDAGATSFLTKPVNKRIILEKLGSLL
jgi:chemosensory pili system protein ChpA (sensor histidine kinase/response regulator)